MTIPSSAAGPSGSRRTDSQKDAAALLRGSQARSWFRQEIDRLLTTVLGHPTLQPALPDGGTFVDGLYREIDDETWKKLTETFF